MSGFKPKKMSYGRRMYIGNMGGEEFFLMPAEWECDWYFGGIYLEGLHPNTEETLRERTRDMQLSDIYDVKNIPSKYLNEGLFQQDMEDDWKQSHDTQEEQERDGEIYYLGFGTHTHCDSVILNQCKGKYETALTVFDKLLLDKKQFDMLVGILKAFYKSEKTARKTKSKKDYEKVEDILEIYETFVSEFPTMPTKEFWILE